MRGYSNHGVTLRLLAGLHGHVHHDYFALVEAIVRLTLMRFLAANAFKAEVLLLNGSEGACSQEVQSLPVSICNSLFRASETDASDSQMKVSQLM